MLSRYGCDFNQGVSQYTRDTVVECVLDAASDCHVCTNKAILLHLRQDNGPLVLD